MYDGVERTASFTVTVIEETNQFTAVYSINDQGMACLGFENLPDGIQSIWLLGPQAGNSAYYYQGSQWYGGGHNISSSSWGGGNPCWQSSSNTNAGEYKFAALSNPTASVKTSAICSWRAST